jgi:GTPase SAR1 family protein
MPNQKTCAGTDQRFKRLTIDGREVGVSVWDTAGQDRFSSLTPFYFRGAHVSRLVGGTPAVVGGGG